MGNEANCTVKFGKQKGRGKGKKQRRKFRVEWREPKVLIIFAMDRRGRLAPKSRPWIDGTFAGPDEAMELLAMHLHRLGAATAKVVVFLADGAPWIWDRLDWVTQRVGLKGCGRAIPTVLRGFLCLCALHQAYSCHLRLLAGRQVSAIRFIPDTAQAEDA